MRNIKRSLGSHEEYNPVSLARYHTQEELEKEYTRMRENLRKNVDRIKKSEFGDAAIVKAYQEFDPARSYGSKQELAMKLSRLEALSSMNASTLTGLRVERANILETLQDRGYTAITKKNFSSFTKFMDSTRSLALSILRYRYTRRGIAVGADRNKRLELFNIAQRKGISDAAITKDFRFFVNHIDELSKLPDRAKGRAMGARTVRKLLKQQ